MISFFSVLFETVVLSLRARERSSKRTFLLSRLIPSMRFTSSSITAFRYSLGSREISFSSVSRFPGQPPRTVSMASVRRSTSPDITGDSLPAQSSCRLIMPMESPDS